jgi:anti-sigma-K factor RskA
MNRIDELIALAALGELDEGEQAELDRAAHDPVVAAALRDALDTAALLQTANPVAPPPSLRARVLDMLDDTPQLPVTAPADAGDAPHAAVAPVVSLAERRIRRSRFLLAAAAAVVMVAGVGGLLASRSSSGDDVVAAVLDADDVVLRPLSGSLDGSVSVSYSPSVGAIVVMGESLDSLPADRTLQLWLVDDDGATPVGVFRPDDDGSVRVRFDDIDPTGFVLGVTVEPAGGSDQPTLPIVLSA